MADLAHPSSTFEPISVNEILQEQIKDQFRAEIHRMLNEGGGGLAF